jgi:hypothetical protein
LGMVDIHHPRPQFQEPVTELQGREPLLHFFKNVLSEVG